MSRLAHAGDSNTRSPAARERPTHANGFSAASRRGAPATTAKLPPRRPPRPCRASPRDERTSIRVRAKATDRRSLHRRPAISTMLRRVSPRPSSAARHAPRLVAFESLMYVTPSTTATVWHRWSQPFEIAQRLPTRLRESPRAALASAIDASALNSLCFAANAERSTSRYRSPNDARYRAPPLRRCPNRLAKGHPGQPIRSLPTASFGVVNGSARL